MGEKKGGERKKKKKVGGHREREEKGENRGYAPPLSLITPYR